MVEVRLEEALDLGTGRSALELVDDDVVLEQHERGRRRDLERIGEFAHLVDVELDHAEPSPVLHRHPGDEARHPPCRARPMARQEEEQRPVLLDSGRTMGHAGPVPCAPDPKTSLFVSRRPGTGRDVVVGGIQKRVLIVSTVELAGAAIDDLVGDGATTMVVVPAVKQSRLQWLANDDDRARKVAEQASTRLAEKTPGDTVVARAGESDPLLAIKDALAEFAADEILIVTRPEEDASWLEKQAAEGGVVSVHGVPVTRVVLGRDGPLARHR